MRPRNEQDYEQRRQQIINGALEVFATRGFEKATNKQIAQAAGIGSPGLIYHYFKDKADLFRQVIEQRAPLYQLIAHPDALMSLPPREALTLFARRFLKILDNRAAFSALKLMVGEATHQPAIADMLNQLGPGRGLPVLTRYRGTRWRPACCGVQRVD
jgi:AcrR family transcriptional regulator